MHMKRTLFLTVFALLSAACVFAGPPFKTDDPEPVASGGWEFYLFSYVEQNNPKTDGTLPGVEVNYGFLGDFQAHLIVPAGFYSSDGKKWNYGREDIEAGIKYRFIRESDLMPQVGTFPLIEAPTGLSGSNLGTGYARAFLPLWFQKTIGRLTTYAGGGYWINPGPGNLNWVYLGIVAQYAVWDKIKPGLEINYNTAQERSGNADNGADIGATIDLDPNNHILVSVGTSMITESDYNGYLAYQITF